MVLIKKNLSCSRTVHKKLASDLPGDSIARHGKHLVNVVLFFIPCGLLIFRPQFYIRCCMTEAKVPSLDLKYSNLVARFCHRQDMDRRRMYPAPCLSSDNFSTEVLEMIETFAC